MLIIARHGETVANAAGLLQGRIDTELTDRGRVQAKALAAALPAEVGRVVCSPLRRALDTAAAFGHPVEVDERWIEASFGEWEGRELASVRGEIWAARLADGDWAPPGGESLREVGRRVAGACVDLLAAAAEADVVVVTHVSPIKAAVAWALGVDDLIAWRMHVSVASLTTMAVADHGAVVTGFNSVAHLAGGG